MHPTAAAPFAAQAASSHGDIVHGLVGAVVVSAAILLAGRGLMRLLGFGRRR